LAVVMILGVVLPLAWYNTKVTRQIAKEQA
jgi:hypothetical protein